MARLAGGQRTEQGNRVNIILMTNSPFCTAPTGLTGYRWLLSPR
jgi:hypothetical protein